MIFSWTLFLLVFSLLTSSWEQINMESTTKIDVLAQLQQKAIKKQYRKICPEHRWMPIQYKAFLLQAAWT